MAKKRSLLGGALLVALAGVAVGLVRKRSTGKQYDQELMRDPSADRGTETETEEVAENIPAERE